MNQEKAVCLDNNVYIKYFSITESSEAVDQIFQKLLKTHSMLYAPAILGFEFGKVLMKKGQLNEFSFQDQQQRLETLFTFPILIMWDDKLLKSTQEIANELNLYFNDASFLAVSIKKNIPFITEDQELIKKGRKLHKAIFTPEQWC